MLNKVRFLVSLALTVPLSVYAEVCEIQHINYYSVDVVTEHNIDFLLTGTNEFTIKTRDTYGQLSEIATGQKEVVEDGESARLRWTHPTTRVDGSPLAVEEIAGYEIEHVLPYTTQVECDDPSGQTTIGALLQSEISAWSENDLNNLAARSRNAPEDSESEEASEPEPEPNLGNTATGLVDFLDNQQQSLQTLLQEEEQQNPTGQGQPSPDSVITTAEAIAATTSAMSCFNWQVKGVCVWMTCYGPVCTFDFSLKIKNFVPDLLVQSYDHSDAEPWEESRYINSVVQGTANTSWVLTIIGWIESFDVSSVGIQGGVTTQTKKDHHANLHYKFVDAYGNPALAAFRTLAAGTGLFCDGNTEMMFPYFISNLDSIAWRWDVPEMFYPQSWMPLVVEWDLGDMVNNYGPIYPRHGFMTAQDPLKAAVLSAFRAAHVVTRESEPHFYVSIYEPQVDGDWSPEPLDKEDEDTGMWQMLYPEKESECEIFPYEAEPAEERRSEDGSYVWNFWRAYECCQRRGATLVYHTE